MIIPDWREAPSNLKTSHTSFFIRSTITYRGGIITADGMKAGLPEFSPRRYSVIHVLDDMVHRLSVGAVSYVSSFDSTDPYAVHTKFATGQWTTLLQTEVDLTVEQALNWTGEQWTFNNIIETLGQ